MGRKDKPVLLRDADDIQIGNMMRRHRQAKHISLSDMGKKVGYSVSYLSGVENGYVRPSSALITEYEKVLEVKISEQGKKELSLISGTDDIEEYDVLNNNQKLVFGDRWQKSFVEKRLSLKNSDFNGFDFSNFDFSDANLSRTNFSSANLSHANLTRALLYQTNLRGAQLVEADLSRANFNGVDLSGADLSGAIVSETVFANVDFRTVKGLETVIHKEPSTIGINTLFRSEGTIPYVFLSKAGLTDNFIEYSRSLVGRPIQYYTCFIAYASQDHPFAERLYTDLQNNGIRCWFAPYDLRLGESVRRGIDEAIRLYDKLLLILSQHSIESSWTEWEVEVALEKEQQQMHSVLFPIRLDEAVFTSRKFWVTHIRRQRHIGDFTHWQNEDTYRSTLDRLIRDLKA